MGWWTPQLSEQLRRLLSYFFPITVHRCVSEVSGALDIRWEKGRLALNGPHVNYSFNLLHSVMTKALRATGIAQKQKASILNLGMGAGSSVEIIRKDLGLDSPITSVEVDPLIISLAEEYFDIRIHEEHEIVQQDAFYFMEMNQEKFDLIIVDVFIDALVPEKFRQAGFVKNVIGSLAPDGQAIFNHLRDAKDGGYSPLLDLFSGEWSRIEGIPEENEVLLYSDR